LKWEGLNYVEICCGPGRCVIRDEGREIDGTSLAIINHPIFGLLQKALFIDSSAVAVDALTKRIDGLEASGKAVAQVGDYTDPNGIAELLDMLPTSCLNLCFIDPTECDVPFATITAIAETLKKVDFIINVAVGTDASRNLPNAILNPSFGKARQKYASFLGNNEFFARSDIRDLAALGKDEELRRAFVQEYVNALAKLGFRHADARAVKHYYDLLYASGSPRGLEFWMKACQIGPDDQREMVFPQG